MDNNIVLIFTLVLFYSMTVVFYRFLGVIGVYIWVAIATILANIEVTIMIHAFGLEQTLGNILFASTFLATDILSENENRKIANRAVLIGIISSLTFTIISRTWFMFTPAESDWVMPAIETVFANTPRLILVSILVFAISQALDVFIYHKVWLITTKLSGSSDKLLFVRNNLSTLISQLINTVLFTLGAFYGTMDTASLFSIGIASYVVFIFTSLLDTPIVYITRKFKKDGKIPETVLK